MGRLGRLFRRSLFRRPQDDQDLDDEIRFHLREEAELRAARGMPVYDAEREARRAFGNVTAVTEATRAVWISTACEQLVQDLRLGCRIVTTAPAFVAAAVTMIALVIGGNTTVFSMAYGILSRPAPGIGATDLVTLTWVRDDGFVEPGTSYPNFLEIAGQSQVLGSMTGFEYDRFALGHRNGTDALWGALVTPSYFATLQVPIVAGRAFTGADNRSAPSGLVAVISHTVWQEHFLGASDIVGQPIVLNGQPATVIGVAAPEFRGTLMVPPVDVWIPLESSARALAKSDVLSRDERSYVSIHARLEQGRTLGDARTELSAIWRRLQAAYPDVPRDYSISAVSYAATAGGNSIVAMQGDTFLALFQIVTLITLVIVCANVANLLLGRAVGRQRELALRQSLGASRWRVVRMLMAEGAVIAVLAWIAAYLFAQWMTSAAVALIAPAAPPGVSLMIATPDWRVAAYALVLAIIGMVAFTVAPAMRAWRQPLLPWLKAGEQGVVQGRSRLSSGLVVLQLAFSVLLLTCSGLAYRSVFLLGTMDLGFDPRPIVLATVNTAGSAIDRESNTALLERLRQRVQAVPGVEQVSYARSAPREFWRSVAVRRSPSDDPVLVETNQIGPSYLRVHGLAPVAGRELDDDRGRSVPAAVISRALADTLWPGQVAVGRRLLIAAERERGEVQADVVGVAPDAHFGGYRRSPSMHVFLSAPDEPGEATLYVRHRVGLDTVAPAIRRAIRDADQRVPVVTLRTLDAQLEQAIWPVRVLTILLTLFAGGSLLIASIGQYAVVAFDMRRRVREFGLRLALGSSSRQVLESVLREGLRLTVVGLSIGFLLSLATGTGLRGLLYGITPTDAVTYSSVFALLATVSLIACYLPARRAAGINPIEALRNE